MILDCGCLAHHPKCEACKLERRRLAALHGLLGLKRQMVVGSDPQREERIREYRRRVEAGEPIFGDDA